MSKEASKILIPDGGWGWLVVLASFVIQALTIGITYTFGILLVELLQVFNADESTASWIGSIQPCFLYLTGIIAGPLIKRFGWRSVAICGSLLSASGFALSAFVSNIYLLYLTYGLITGIGNGLMYVTSMVCVQHYFQKRRAMATGIAVSGSGVGALFFGTIIPVLLEKLHWRVTLLVEAAIMLTAMFFSALYRPLPNGEVLLNSMDENSTAANDEERRLLTKSLEQELKELKEDEEKADCCPSLDLSLFKEPIFILYASTLILFCMSYHVTYTYTPDRALNILPDIALNKAAFLVSIMGMSNVGSRVFLGAISDRSKSMRYIVSMSSLLLGGILNIMIKVFVTYNTMIIHAVFSGALIGCYASIYPVLLVDLLGIESIEKSLGQSLALASFAFLLGSPFSGWLIKYTDSYDTPFMVVGGAQFISGFFILFIKIIEYMKERKDELVEPVTKDNLRMARNRYISTSFA